MHFFGHEGERGWVSDKSLIPFEGREAFDKFCSKMQQKDKKNKKNYMIAGRRRKAWEFAVKDAESALPLSKAERQALFAVPPVEESRKRPLEATPPPAKRQKRSPSITSPMENQSMAQFTVFCMRRRDAVKREHPGYTPKQVDDLLQAQWDSLDADQKSLFIPMGQDFAHLSKHMPQTTTAAPGESAQITFSMIHHYP